MPTNASPATRSELRHRAMMLGHELRASLPWWNIVERVRIGNVTDKFRPAVSN
jgi:hypothetical protein